MKISKGSKNKKIKGKNFTSIIDIFFDNKYIIYVFQGAFGENDILIKYSEECKRVRTPSHIHWTVDLLLKLQAEKNLTRNYIKEIRQAWQKCQPLKNNDDETLKKIVNGYVNTIDGSKYKKLDNYGEYKIEFLTVLITLLIVQEKTKNNEAYMFGKILDALLEDDLDIFKIMSVAGFRGRG